MKTTPVAVRLAAVFASAAITWSLLAAVFALAEPSASAVKLAQGMASVKVVRTCRGRPLPGLAE